MSLKRSIILIALTLCAVLCACGQAPAKTENGASWQEQYDLGMRYLNEGKYEEAILAFNTAIEIDPKQADAYVGLAKAYNAAGDPDAAKRTLEQGLATAKETDELQVLMDELNVKTTGPAKEPNSNPTYTAVPIAEEVEIDPETGWIVKKIDPVHVAYYDDSETLRKLCTYRNGILGLELEYDANGMWCQAIVYDQEGNYNHTEVATHATDGTLSSVSIYATSGDGQPTNQYEFDTSGICRRITQTVIVTDYQGNTNTYSLVCDYDESGTLYQAIQYKADGTQHYVYDVSKWENPPQVLPASHWLQYQR